MPNPNEHACRISDPGQFVRFRRNNDTDPHTIIGFRKDGTSELQSFRYPKDKWSSSRAHAHCQKHDGQFEAAGGEAKSLDDGGIERRYIPAGQSEMRLIEGDDTKPKILVGYAMVFNSLSEDMGGFRERFAPGAFSKSLKRGDDVVAVIEHQGGLSTLGRVSAGTLSLEEDNVGLRSEIVLPDTQAGRDIAILIGRGDITHMSSAFVVPQHGQVWARGEKGHLVRTINEVSLLHDVCPVNHPVYLDTSVALRSRDLWQETTDEAIAAEHEYQKRRLEAFDTAPSMG